MIIHQNKKKKGTEITQWIVDLYYTSVYTRLHWPWQSKKKSNAPIFFPLLLFSFLCFYSSFSLSILIPKKSFVLHLLLLFINNFHILEMKRCRNKKNEDQMKKNNNNNSHMYLIHDILPWEMAKANSLTPQIIIFFFCSIRLRLFLFHFEMF